MSEMNDVFSNSFLVEQSYNTMIGSYENSVITSSARFIIRFEKSLFEIKSTSYLSIKRLAPDLFKALSKESVNKKGLFKNLQPKRI